MFNVSEWLKSALIDGVRSGVLAREYAVVRTVDYLTKGVLSQAQVEEIAAGIEPTPEPVEEPVQ